MFSRTVPDVEPHRDDFGLWRIKFTAPGDAAAMMDIGGASKLAAELYPVDKEFAEKLEEVVLEHFPKRMNRAGLPCGHESDSRIVLEGRPA